MINYVSLALGLQEHYLAKRFKNPEPLVLMRGFIYPEYDSQTNDTLWGVQEHSDYGGLTFLYQDQAGGLEARNPMNGKWLEIPPLKNTFVVNIGDMLEKWTHGAFVATPHRV